MSEEKKQRLKEYEKNYREANKSKDLNYGFNNVYYFSVIIIMSSRQTKGDKSLMMHD